MLKGAAAAARAASSATHKPTTRQCPSRIWPLSPRGYRRLQRCPLRASPVQADREGCRRCPFGSNSRGKGIFSAGRLLRWFLPGSAVSGAPVMIQYQRGSETKGMKVGLLTKCVHCASIIARACTLACSPNCFRPSLKPGEAELRAAKSRLRPPEAPAAAPGHRAWALRAGLQRQRQLPPLLRRKIFPGAAAAR